MADAADRAGELIERTQAALEASIVLTRAAPHIDSADECAECGDLIPSARQIAVPGCQLCTDCATLIERASEHR